MAATSDIFRRESGRIIAALSRIFGFDNLALAEDVAQDVFCRALEIWRLRGVPANPSAWLMTAAKHRAIDLLRRERTARRLVPELGRLLESEWTLVPTVNRILSDEAIQDDELRMMFSCCDPQLSEATAVTLMLRLLCGLTAAEIAHALFTKRSAVEKRIERGKTVLATSNRLFDIADSELAVRSSAVRRALYLLFNEGYHGSSAQRSVRTELCRDAMRLAALLLDNPLVAAPANHALCALMWLHAARLSGRTDAHGELLAASEQDRSRWDARLIATGTEFLNRSATGTEITVYHIEAAIAAIHCAAASPADTQWPRLVWLYDQLLQLAPSPVVALNRAIAVAQAEGPQRGIEELRAIPDREKLAGYPFFPAALAELELRAGNAEVAREYFQRAADLARNAMERRFFTRQALSSMSTPAGRSRCMSASIVFGEA